VHKSWFTGIPALALWLMALPAHALGEDEYLPPEQAFQYTVAADERSVTVEWKVSPGYYLYKKRMGIAVASGGARVGEPSYPAGEAHEDEYFGKQEVFRGDFTVTAPLQGARPGDTLLLKLKWQGCADAGLCYPPSEWDAPVKVVSAAAVAAASADKLFGKGSSVMGEDEYLPVDEAFVLTGDALNVNTLQLNWRIAEGYYLYKNRMKVAPAGRTPSIGALVLPKGEDHYDEYFGNQEIYRDSVDATFSVPPVASGHVEVSVTYQGCADAGLCYPPETKLLTISLEGAPAVDASSGPDGSGTGSGYVSEQDSILAKLATGSLLLMVAVGYLGGLLMSFTPCVLPMVPILSGIIAGGGQNMSPGRGFLLSLIYVAGIAVVYVTMGVLAAYVGGGVNLQAIFNQPAILIPFSLLFVVLAAAMFGAFTLQMPSFIQSRLSDASNRQRAGTFVGVGVMGALSALIVSACVAPVLIGALTYIAKSGDVTRGAVTMLAISLGMGTPLLLVGASAGALLPRAGAWMETIKNLFGVMFLAVAAWLLSRITPGWADLLLWAATAGALAWVLARASARASSARIALRMTAAAASLYGTILMIGAISGGTDPLRPIPQLAAEVKHLQFKRFKTVDDLQREVSAASAAGKPVMVDFYADWCVSCIEMEHKTFTQAEVQQALQGVVLLQADVTRNDDEDKRLYRHFDIVGPPTIAFYGADGMERRNFRVVGFMKAAEFAAVVRQAVAPAAPTVTQARP
jgi:thioredoxin:protein disulfide reductase